ncbi:MAG: RNA-protein complex protein Nop10 [Methanomicrobiales archaeon]|nr:RNA-protein complex protein Nop10 [Methanomicrobiales archaeon]
MNGRIRRCPVDQTYSLQERCPGCGSVTMTAHPARYSPQDRYGEYRRVMRQWMR